MSELPKSAPANDEAGARRAQFRVQLSALVFVAHIFAMLCMALPASSGTGNRQAWQAPRVQRNFQRAAELFNRLALTTDAAELEETAFQLVHGYLTTRRGLQQLVKPYTQVSAMRQRWRLFASGGPRGIRTEISVLEPNGWRVVYLRGSSPKTGPSQWMSDFMAYYRTRKLCGRARKLKRREWQRFATWLARRAATDFPTASRLRLRAYLETAPPPSKAREGLSGAQRIHQELEHDLEDFR